MKRISSRCSVLAGVTLVGLALFAGRVNAQLEPPPEPAGNPLTVSKANLGKVLFWDEQMSWTRTVACGTCHIPSAGGADPRSLASPLAINPGADGVFGGDDDVFGSPGVPRNSASGDYLWSEIFGISVQATGRRPGSAINAGYSDSLFWDGRAGDEFVDPVTEDVVLPTGGALESQAVGPPVSSVEMGHVGELWTDLVARITMSKPLALATEVPSALLDWLGERTYPQLFEEAFGSTELTAARVAMAIASYERTQFSNQAPFDEFLATGTGLTAQEEAGHQVFTTAGSCDVCHDLAIMTDHQFHYIGVRPHADDVGRFAVTQDEEDMGKMRTPSLRNLELRAPYMRNGRFQTIAETVDFYDRGGDFDAPNKHPQVHELLLTPQWRADLIAFLGRPLTDPRVRDELPPFDRPKLFSESNRVPTIEGSGLPGSGGIVPKVIAIEPPMLGNPSFTVGVFDALGNAPALLVIDDSDPGLAVPASGSFAFEAVNLAGGIGAGVGFGSVNLVIPSDASQSGRDLYGRWYVTDTGGGEAAAVSPLFRFTLFRPRPSAGIFSDGFESGDLSAW